MKHQRIPTRLPLSAPAAHQRPLFPKDTATTARYAVLIDTAMRTQRPDLKRIG